VATHGPAGTGPLLRVPDQGTALYGDPVDRFENW